MQELLIFALCILILFLMDGRVHDAARTGLLTVVKASDPTYHPVSGAAAEPSNSRSYYD